ncbi:TetR/AcrR family transcriptional regulator [Sneathiella limimaris]|uniref:TetR/AcrR family transcriptional regulator n=1 Tax=Sneathiella limimaris TaxID=1964213 RepID=UPI00146DA507|nr:TetR/AcrR family transcriptional regulator [Sneathiella limimaris]
MKAAETREEIITAADKLFYEQGFEATSFSHIAEAVKISRGNFYYHFKTKDDILSAVIARRISDREALLVQWEGAAKSPKDCIIAFIHILIQNQSKIMLYGCPIGTLSTELAKLDHPGASDANRLFDLFRTWLERQFQALGCGGESNHHAMHILMRSQGIATLANAFKDEAFVRAEVTALEDWLDQVIAEIPASTA